MGNNQLVQVVVRTWSSNLTDKVDSFKALKLVCNWVRRRNAV
jgi:hypothetical protein